MRKQTALLAIFLAILTIGLLYGFGPTLAATPTPVKVTELTPVTTVTPNTQLYIIQDPTGTPVSRRTSVESAVHAGILPITIDGLNVVIGGNVQITGTTSISGTTIVSDTLTVDTLTLPDHTHDGTANSGGSFDAANLSSGTAITNTVLTADGLGGASWEEAPGGSGDYEFPAGDDGQVWTLVSATPTWADNDAAGYTQGCRVYNDAAIVVANSTPYTLTYNSELYDTDTMHSIVDATDRITVTTAGVYIVWANVQFAYDADGIRTVYLKHNGDTVGLVQQNPVGGSATTLMQVSTIYDCEADDYFQVVVEHNAGGNLNVNSSAQYSPHFAAQRIG